MSSTSSISSSILNGLVGSTNWSALADEISAASLKTATGQLTKNKTKQKNVLSTWQSFNTILSRITDYIKTNKLNKTAGYDSYLASRICPDSTITPSTVLSASIGKGTITAGTYSIQVSQLAAAEKISSDAFASSTAALGISGDMVINGVTISISSTDNLANVVKKINAAGAGVSASVLNVSDTDHRLALQSTAQGSKGIVLSSSGASNVLEALTLTNQGLANPSGSDAVSRTFSDSGTALGTLLGLSSARSGTVSIRGTDGVARDIFIDLSTDSLQDVADRINEAGITGVTASMDTTPADGTTVYSLRLSNVASSDLADDSNVLRAMGLLSDAARTVIQKGKDAVYTIDGTTITSSSNTVTGVINGITLTLSGTYMSEDKPIILEIAKDYSAVSSQLSTLISNINDALSFITKQNAYSSDSSDTASVLIGNSTLSRIKQTITSVIFGTVRGNSTYTTLKSIGISVGSNGSLAIDTDVFAVALSDNPAEAINAVRSFSANVCDALNVYVDPITGTLISLQNTINARIDQLTKQIGAVTERCNKQASILSARFSALETLITKKRSHKRLSHAAGGCNDEKQ